MATGEIVVRLADYTEVKGLIDAARLLDDHVNEFGFDPMAIGETYQYFHDALYKLLGDRYAGVARRAASKVELANGREALEYLGR